MADAPLRAPIQEAMARLRHLQEEALSCKPAAVDKVSPRERKRREAVAAMLQEAVDDVGKALQELDRA